MTESSSGDNYQIPLSTAVKQVNVAIGSYTNHLKKISDGDEQDPILLEGETSAGYSVHMMVDPKIVAEVMLNYDYPIYHVLELDVPNEMWEELAVKVGLISVFSADI